MILAAIPDLLLLSRVNAAAVQAGESLRNESASLEQFLLCVRDTKPRLIVLDLDRVSWNLKLLISQIRPHPAIIVGFGSHVHVETLQAARDAGVDAVVYRSQLFDELNRLLSS